MDFMTNIHIYLTGLFFLANLPFSGSEATSLLPSYRHCRFQAPSTPIEHQYLLINPPNIPGINPPLPRTHSSFVSQRQEKFIAGPANIPFLGF